MRLLNTHTLTLTTFIGETPDYVVLSHRWEEEELILEDITKNPISDTSNPARAKRGFSKVQGTCALALKDGFDWVWIDSCCIDKSSSAELQEAINSMFRWYEAAQICYAYLGDVPDAKAGFDVAFEESLWFTRGWTLQELLAPSSVEFYAADWTLVGSKASRADQIASITGIDPSALKNSWDDMKDKYFAAEKISWAAHRFVTRAEDMAYCLLGLFDANMPLLYGEGGLKAFLRLQQIVFDSESDYTLFLFSRSNGSVMTPLVAESVKQFCRRIHCTDDCTRWATYIPDHIPYSQIRPMKDARWPRFDDHYLKLVKGGAMLKVRPLSCESSVKIQRLDSDDACSQPPPGMLIVPLPFTLVGYEHHVFGIILAQLQTSGFVRYGGCILVDMENLRAFESEPKTLMIYDRFARLAHSVSVSAQFEFHSSLFKVSSWNTRHKNEQLSTSGRIVTLPNPDYDPFALTIRTSSTSSKISLVIVLGDSMQEARLQAVQVQGDGLTSRSASKRVSPTDRITIPLESTQGCINVTLRRLCTRYNGSRLRVATRYRVDVEYAGDSIHSLKPGKTNAETEDNDADERSVDITAVDCV